MAVSSSNTGLDGGRCLRFAIGALCVPEVGFPCGSFQPDTW